MSLREVKHWVFDMDGTLTVAVHDFAAIRVALDIPARGRHSHAPGGVAGGYRGGQACLVAGARARVGAGFGRR